MILLLESIRKELEKSLINEIRYILRKAIYEVRQRSICITSR